MMRSCLWFTETISRARKVECVLIFRKMILSASTRIGGAGINKSKIQVVDEERMGGGGEYV